MTRIYNTLQMAQNLIIGKHPFFLLLSCYNLEIISLEPQNIYEKIHVCLYQMNENLMIVILLVSIIRANSGMP